MSLFATDGHLTDEGISVYAEALRLDKLDSLDEAVASHIQSCTTCRSQAVDLYALVKTLDYSPVAQQRPAMRARLHWIRYTPWVAAAMLAGLVFYFFNAWGPDPAAPPLADQQKELPAPAPAIAEKKESEKPHKPDQKPAETPAADLLAMAFEPNDHLETLVGDVTRSGQVKIKSPVAGQAFKPGKIIKFEWEGAEPGLEIVILNNNDEIIFRDRASDRTLSRQAPGTPGLYYWKLETEDDLLYVGKFLVK